MYIYNYICRECPIYVLCCYLIWKKKQSFGLYLQLLKSFYQDIMKNRFWDIILENHDLRLYRHLRGTFTLEMSFVGIASLCSSWCYNAFHLYFGKYNNPIFLSISANKDLFLVVFILVFRFSSISNCS